MTHRHDQRDGNQQQHVRGNGLDRPCARSSIGRMNGRCTTRIAAGTVRCQMCPCVRCQLPRPPPPIVPGLQLTAVAARHRPLRLDVEHNACRGAFADATWLARPAASDFVRATAGSAAVRSAGCTGTAHGASAAARSSTPPAAAPESPDCRCCTTTRGAAANVSNRSSAMPSPETTYCRSR